MNAAHHLPRPTPPPFRRPEIQSSSRLREPKHDDDDDDDGATTNVSPSVVPKNGPHVTQAMQRILALPPLFPEDSDDDAPTTVSDQPPGVSRPPKPRASDPVVLLRTARLISERPVTDSGNADANAPVLEDDGEGFVSPLAVVGAPAAPGQLRMLAGALWLVISLTCALAFRLALAVLKLACTTVLFLAFAVKAVGSWLLFRSWSEWRRAWRRVHGGSASAEGAKRDSD